MMCPTEMREKVEKSLRFCLLSFPFRGWKNRFPIQISCTTVYVRTCTHFFVSNFDISFPRATFFLVRHFSSDTRFLGWSRAISVHAHLCYKSDPLIFETNFPNPLSLPPSLPVLRLIFRASDSIFGGPLPLLFQKPICFLRPLLSPLIQEASKQAGHKLFMRAANFLLPPSHPLFLATNALSLSFREK